MNPSILLRANPARRCRAGGVSVRTRSFAGTMALHPAEDPGAAFPAWPASWSVRLTASASGVGVRGTLVSTKTTSLSMRSLGFSFLASCSWSPTGRPWCRPCGKGGAPAGPGRRGPGSPAVAHPVARVRRIAARRRPLVPEGPGRASASPQGAEERPDVAGQGGGFLHGGEMAAAFELGPLRDGGRGFGFGLAGCFRDDRGALGAGRVVGAVPVGGAGGAEPPTGRWPGAATATGRCWWRSCSSRRPGAPGPSFRPASARPGRPPAGDSPNGAGPGCGPSSTGSSWTS